MPPYHEPCLLHLRRLRSIVLSLLSRLQVCSVLCSKSTTANGCPPKICSEALYASTHDLGRPVSFRNTATLVQQRHTELSFLTWLGQQRPFLVEETPEAMLLIHLYFRSFFGIQDWLWQRVFRHAHRKSQASPTQCRNPSIWIVALSPAMIGWRAR